MTRTRLRKVAADFGHRWDRTLLTFLGMTLALWGVGTVLSALAILASDLDENYARTNPADLVLTTGVMEPDLAARLPQLPGLADAESRPLLNTRLEVEPGRWMPMALSVVEDFDSLRIARFYPQKPRRDASGRSERQGAWPPPPGTFLMERDGRFFVRARLDTPLRIRLPDGRVVSSALSGLAFDPGMPPSRMEQVIYGYITRATLEGWGYSPGSERFLLKVEDAGPAAAASTPNGTAPATGSERVTRHGPAPGSVATSPLQAAADHLELWVNYHELELRRLEVLDAREHPHQFQLDAIIVLLTGLAVISLAMCAALIVNLVDAVMTHQARAIGILKAIGGRSPQIAGDYLLAIGVLGLLAGAASAPFALSAGRLVARFVAAFLNFELLSEPPRALILAVLTGVGALVAMLVAAAGIARIVRAPVLQAITRFPAERVHGFADAIGRLLAPLPQIPKLALRAVMRRPRRALLTALTLALGLVFFVTALNLRTSLMQTVASVQRTRPHDLSVQFRAAYPISELAAWVREQPNVREAEFWQQAMASIPAGTTRGNEAPVHFVPQSARAIRPDVIAGRWIDPSRPAGIVVSQRMLIDQPGLRVGGAYRLTIGARSTDVEVVGVVKEFGPGLIYAPAPLAARFELPAGSANLMFVALEVSSFANQTRAASQLEGSLLGTQWQVARILTSRLLEAIVENHVDGIAQLILLVACIALAVGAAGIASSISVSVVERYREIGVLKAIGGRSGQVVLLFVVEALLIALLAWLVALALAPWLSRAIADAFGSVIIQYPFDYRAAPWASAIALAVAVGTALLAGALPVRGAVRTTIYNALRVP